MSNSAHSDRDDLFEDGLDYADLDAAIVEAGGYKAIGWSCSRA
ncbi:MAG: hypothetical protein U5P41_07400 [Gammaproteobacteria bacterium]|nr:hypothetical protein [Gammaproteobacteria bacterium]